MTDNDSKARRIQAHRLRLTLLAVANTSLESAVMGVYVWAGEVTVPMWVAFMLCCVGMHAAFALVIRLGLNQRLRSPDMLVLQIASSCAMQSLFILLIPQLAILFLVGICVTYIFAMVSFNPRQFKWAWLLAGLSIGLALFFARDEFRYPAVNDLTTFALWLYFFLAIRQLTAFGAQFSSLRMKLSQRNRELSESLDKLEALAGQQRLVERERMARELHDTLLQGIQGLMMRFQSIAQRLPADVPERQMMDEALDRADRVMQEGRDELGGLRGVVRAPSGLADALASAGEELMADYGPRFAIERSGGPRPLQPIVAEEAYRIGREALLNAFQHAQAQEVRVALVYGDDDLKLVVRDDGHGMDPQVLVADRRLRSRGVPGMRERARRLGGRLTIGQGQGQGQGQGTEVELAVPAALAYVVDTVAETAGLIDWVRARRSDP